MSVLNMTLPYPASTGCFPLLYRHRKFMEGNPFLHRSQARADAYQDPLIIGYSRVYLYPLKVITVEKWWLLLSISRSTSRVPRSEANYLKEVCSNFKCAAE